MRGLLEDLVLVFDEKGFEILFLQLVHLVLFLLVHGGLEGELSAVGINEFPDGVVLCRNLLNRFIDLVLLHSQLGFGEQPHLDLLVSPRGVHHRQWDFGDLLKEGRGLLAQHLKLLLLVIIGHRL